MGRAPCCDKANVKKGPWSPEEDAKLKTYIEKYGTGGNWIALPQKVGLKRCGKSCRLRWLNYLRPNIKHGGFTEEEDNIICSLYISIGSRWSIIAAQLPGRTDNDIKNYWNTRLKKKLLGRRRQNRLAISGQGEKEEEEEEHNYNLQNLSSSALERLQLHMQLQNPLSFYNNPSLWPKLINPLMQQKMMHRSPSGSGELAGPINCFSPPSEGALHVDTSKFRTDDQAKNIMGQYPPGTDDDNLPRGSSFAQAAELDDSLMINNKNCNNFLGNINQLDCLKLEMDDGSSLAWWANEFDVNSTSSNSWDSASMVNHHGQTNEMYGDYELGYSLQ